MEANKQRIFFVINPVSGYNKKEDVPQLIRDNLDLDKFEFDFKKTEHKGHATDIAKEAIEKGFDIVVACGGDGTVNEVAKAVVNTDVQLGILPSGSGNGFAMHIGMGRNKKKAIRKLNESSPRVIDSCTVNNQFFLNVAGVGFDALIAYKAENDTKRGLQMYVSMVSKEMAQFKAENFKVKVNEQTIEGPFTTIAVANAAMYGYNFTIAPTAELTDGMLDIVFIKKASVLRTLATSWRMLNKSLNKSSLVEIIKAKELTISTGRPYYFHIDGESFLFENKLHFKIHPRSIKVLFPKGSEGLN